MEWALLLRCALFVFYLLGCVLAQDSLVTAFYSDAPVRQRVLPFLAMFVATIFMLYMVVAR